MSKDNQAASPVADLRIAKSIEQVVAELTCGEAVAKLAGSARGRVSGHSGDIDILTPDTRQAWMGVGEMSEFASDCFYRTSTATP